MIHYTNGLFGFRLLLQVRGSVFPKACLWAVPAAAIAWFVDDSYSEGTDNWVSDWDFGSNAGAIWSSFNFVVGFLVVFRTQAAYSRYWEGASLVQQARGNLFNACSSLISFSSNDRSKKRQVEEFQHLLVRLMSMMHCVGLQTVADMEDVKFQFFNTDGMDRSCLRFLSMNTDKQQRCEIVIQWIQRLVVEGSRTGIVDVPAPILTRFFQELSLGATRIINARIMTGIPFPFPYAQMLFTMLLFHWVLTPFLCVVILKSKLWACVFTFITVFSLWGVNYIAAEIESPFGNDANDLPIHALQKDMNKSLWILLHPNTQAVPRFNFSPEKHRKWDVICQSNFNRMSFENRSIFRPRVTGMWTQGRDSLASTEMNPGVHDIPSMQSEPQYRQQSMGSSFRGLVFSSSKSGTKSGLFTTRTFSAASGKCPDAGESELPPPRIDEDELPKPSIGVFSVVSTLPTIDAYRPSDRSQQTNGSCVVLQPESSDSRIGRTSRVDELRDSSNPIIFEEEGPFKENAVPDEFYLEYKHKGFHARSVADKEVKARHFQ